MTGLEMIKVYRENKDKYLPMISSAERIVEPRNGYGDVNIGWNAGVIGENRPYYVECWATDGITMITIYMSDIGIEDYTVEQVEKMFLDSGYFSYKEKHRKPDMMKFEDSNNNSFFSFNVAVGVDEDTCEDGSQVFIEGAHIYPFSLLNEYNSSCIAEEDADSEGNNTEEDDEEIIFTEEGYSVRKGPYHFSGNYVMLEDGKEIPGRAVIELSDKLCDEELSNRDFPAEIKFDFCNISIACCVDLEEHTVWGDHYIFGENMSPEYDADKLTNYFFTTIYHSFDDSGSIGFPIYCCLPDSRPFLKDENQSERHMNEKDECQSEGHMNRAKGICPVCGKFEFKGSYDDCPVCGWIHDLYQERCPDEDGCANSMSLEMAREAYKKGEKVW